MKYDIYVYSSRIPIQHVGRVESNYLFYIFKEMPKHEMSASAMNMSERYLTLIVSRDERTVVSDYNYRAHFPL